MLLARKATDFRGCIFPIIGKEAPGLIGKEWGQDLPGGADAASSRRQGLPRVCGQACGLDGGRKQDRQTPGDAGSRCGGRDCGRAGPDRL